MKLLDITAEISVQKFEAIVSFILKSGDRRTYCNMYNNNPHFKIEGFDIYLNPIHQRINMGKDNLSDKISDYNSITIYDHNTDADFQYTHIHLEESKVCLYNYYDQSAEEFAFVKNALLRIYFPKMERALNSL